MFYDEDYVTALEYGLSQIKAGLYWYRPNDYAVYKTVILFATLFSPGDAPTEINYLMNEAVRRLLRLSFRKSSFEERRFVSR